MGNYSWRGNSCYHSRPLARTRTQGPLRPTYRKRGPRARVSSNGRVFTGSAQSRSPARSNTVSASLRELDTYDTCCHPRASKNFFRSAFGSPLAQGEVREVRMGSR